MYLEYEAVRKGTDEAEGKLILSRYGKKGDDFSFNYIVERELENGAEFENVYSFGYARSLGVNCTHCHVPDKWESEDKPQKQIGRDMSAMVAKINGEMLKGIKNLTSASPTINCTTCHRGQVIPALNLPAPAK